LRDQKHRVLPLFEFQQISIADTTIMAIFAICSMPDEQFG
jgi:hypothetical protein